MIDDQLSNISALDNSTNPKELFDKKDIEVKTELTAEQVMIVSRLKILGKIYKEKYKLDFIDILLDIFLQLQVSKDRGSRKEFVSSFQSKNDEKMGGLMDKFNFSVNR